VFENTRILTKRLGKIFPLCSHTGGKAPVGIMNSSVWWAEMSQLESRLTEEAMTELIRILSFRLDIVLRDPQWRQLKNDSWVVGVASCPNCTSVMS